MNQDFASGATVIRIDGQHGKLERTTSEAYLQGLADLYILPARQLFIHHHALSLLQSLPGP